MKVVLIGFRGTGKTTVGRILANRLGLPFYDTDALIEQRAGMPIPEIFRRAGEAHFRALEREVIASLRTAEGVIATGGGRSATRQTSQTSGGTAGSSSSPRLLRSAMSGSPEATARG